MRALIGLTLILSGCGVFDAPPPERDRDAVTIRFIISDEGVPGGAMGVAHSAGDTCTIIIRPSAYPACVTHEVAHCLGWRHAEKYNTAYCRP